MTEMRELIARVAGEQRTVLVSSHILSELEHVSDWLLIIDDGRLVYAGPADGFAATARREIVLEPAEATELLRLADVVARHGLEAGRQGRRLVVAVNVVGDGHEPRRLAASLNQAAASSGIVLAEVHVRTPTLESKYLDLVEGARR
jgi:ABC-2 type transport system ATP-binding protein